MSFRDQLNLFIQDKGYVTYNELEAFAKSKNHKVETMTRALRPSQSPNLERIMKGSAIVAYKWKSSKNSQTRTQACCSDMAVFGEHFKPCINIKKEVIGALF